MAARRAHNPKAVGSNPTPATKLNLSCFTTGDYTGHLLQGNEVNIEAPVSKSNRGFSVSKEIDLQSLLRLILNLPQTDRQLLSSLLQSKTASILSSPSDGILDWQNKLSIRGLSSHTIELYLHSLKKVLKQYPNPTSQEIRTSF